MDIKALAQIDLNLLVALQVLLEEGNVSKSAQRLFISQSAMSKTLGRLRELFDDPLFTRGAGGMVPTVRAAQIGAQLPAVLHGVQSMVLPAEFDPASFSGEFYLEIPDYIAQWALPILCRRLLRNAPGLRINTLSGEQNHLELMAAGELDFTIQIERATYPHSLR